MRISRSYILVFSDLILKFIKIESVHVPTFPVSRSHWIIDARKKRLLSRTFPYPTWFFLPWFSEALCSTCFFCIRFHELWRLVFWSIFERLSQGVRADKVKFSRSKQRLRHGTDSWVKIAIVWLSFRNPLHLVDLASICEVQLCSPFAVSVCCADERHASGHFCACVCVCVWICFCVCVLLFD